MLEEFITAGALVSVFASLVASLLAQRHLARDERRREIEAEGLDLKLKLLQEKASLIQELTNSAADDNKLSRAELLQLLKSLDSYKETLSAVHLQQDPPVAAKSNGDA